MMTAKVFIGRLKKGDRHQMEAGGWRIEDGEAVSPEVKVEPEHDTAPAPAIALGRAASTKRGRLNEGQHAVEPTLSVPVSPGELLDKISILEIKAERIDDRAKLENVRHELGVLREVRQAIAPSAALSALTAELKSVNESLWDVEDSLRDCERRLKFGPRFVELARSVYRHNDRRSVLKRQINELLGSRLIEEKAYAPY